MTEPRVRVWRIPIIINLAIVAGLALALLIDAGMARTLAWTLLCVPLGTVVYGYGRGKRAPARSRGRRRTR
jgi:hypothetical protein